MTRYELLLSYGYTPLHIFIMRAMRKCESKRITKKELTKTLKTHCRFNRR